MAATITEKKGFVGGSIILKSFVLHAWNEKSQIFEITIDLYSKPKKGF